MKLNIIPITISAISLALFEIVFILPKSVYYIFPIILLAVYVSTFLICKNGPAGKKWKSFLVFPMMLTVSFLGFSFVLTNKILVQVVYIFYAYFNYYYYFSIYNFMHRPSRYRPFTIENVSSYGNLIMFFLFSSLVYGLQSLIDTPIWILALSILAYTAMAVHQVFWAYKIESGSKILFVAICCLVIVELAWTISYLPVRYMIAGMMLSLCYYVILGLARHYLTGRLDSKTVKLYLGFGAASLLIILLTSQWI